MRRQTFIDVMRDKPVDECFPSDLQTYVNKMQFWSGSVTKREINVMSRTSLLERT
jgi:hypothetical protein